MEEVLGIVLLILFVLILQFLLFRWFWCWYFKINARLREQERTNALLQNIFDAIVQGNNIGAMQVGTTASLKSQIAKGGKKVEDALAAGQNAAQAPIQIPQSGETDDSLPSL